MIFISDWMIFNYSRWFFSNDIHLQQLIFYRVRQYSYKTEDDGCLHEMIVNHCRWYSTTGDDNQPMRIIINHWGWWSADIDDISSTLVEYFIFGIFEKYHLAPNYLSRTISISHIGRWSSIMDDYLNKHSHQQAFCPTDDRLYLIT
jgi:hypothetical protein